MGCVPLHYAVLLNDQRLVECLLKDAPSSAIILNNDGFSPFHLAARSDDYGMFQLFLSLSPHCSLQVTKTGQNVLHISVERKNESIISAIVEDRKLSEMINQPDEDGNTPLHLAAYMDNENMQNLLLKGQVRVLPLRNNKGLTFREITMSQKERRQNEVLINHKLLLHFIGVQVVEQCHKYNLEYVSMHIHFMSSQFYLHILKYINKYTF